MKCGSGSAKGRMKKAGKMASGGKVKKMMGGGAARKAAIAKKAGEGAMKKAGAAKKVMDRRNASPRAGQGVNPKVVAQMGPKAQKASEYRKQRMK